MISEAKKALFLDLDGTLLTDDKKIPEGNRRALEQMLAAGHSVIITTGRPLSSALLEARELGLTGEGCYLIAYNGGLLYDTANRKVIFEKTIPLPLVYDVFDEANARGVHIQTYDDTDVVVEPRCDNDIVRYYCGRIGMTHRVIDDIRHLEKEPVKMLLIDLESRDHTEPLRQWIIEKHGGDLDGFFSSSAYLEIVSKGLDKGSALEQMAGLLHIPMENTISAGDAENDVPMIRAAHLGCAVANAVPECRAVADYITERDNNHDAVAEIIEKFIL